MMSSTLLVKTLFYAVLITAVKCKIYNDVKI